MNPCTNKPVRPIARARQSARNLSVAVSIGVLLCLLNLIVHFSGELHGSFGGIARLPMTRPIINVLFIWLVVLLSTAFFRWRRTERDRAALERILSSISPDALLVVNADRTIAMANASLKRILGYEPEEVISRRTDLLYDDRRSTGSDRQEIRDALEREGYHVGFATGRHKAGHTVPLEIVSAAMSRQEGAVLLIRDIAGRVREEEEKEKLRSRLRRQQKMESLGVLAGGIAHDFNNLLAGILGNAELAAQKLKNDPAVSGSIAEIRDAATHAAGLCRDMLAYAGKGRLHVQPLDPSQVVHSQAHILSITVPRHQKLEYELPAGLPSVEGDLAQLQQVVLYLAANAAEAIGESDGAVTLRTGVRECDAPFLADVAADEPLPPGRYAFIEVADNGPGMSAATRARLYEPFFSTKSTHRGLGLPSVRGIVMGHGGGVKVWSEPDKGTVVTVLLPCSSRVAPPPADVARAAAAAPPADESAADWKGQGVVLLIEDDPSVASFAEQALRRAGLTVLRANDGEEGLRVFAEKQAEIDLILLDMTMPRLNGRIVLERVRAARPEAVVILCSGDPSSVTGLVSDGFLQKPYGLSVLLGAVRDGLARRRPPA